MLSKKSTLLFIILALSIVLGACAGGTEQEKKFAKVFSNLNKDWQLYEIETSNDNTVVIHVEVSDNVPFREAKKAMEELQKIDPKLKGYIEFYNSQVGIVLRKVELIPAT